MRKSNIGIIKGLLSLGVMITGSFTLKGQDSNVTKEKIMEIKLNDDFIFGEGVSDDKEIAYGVALDDLLTFANEIKDRNSQEKLSMSDLITKVETLVYENGSRFEVIVYIPFKIVIETSKKPSTKGGIVITKPGMFESESGAGSEKEDAGKPVANNLAFEEVVVEERVAIKEEPETLTVQESVRVDDSLAKEEPQNSPLQKKSNIEASPSNIYQQYEGAVEDFLLTQDNFSEIKTFLSDMKREGKIVETGATDSTFNLPSDASLIIMDELGGILAVLSPVNTQGRINYRTHKNDSENNYNSKFILWYKK